MRQFKDHYGRYLHQGDLVEDTNKKIIGRVVYRIRSGKLAVKAEKGLSWSKLSYVPISPPYFYNACGKHGKIYWFFHRYRLNNIVLLERRQRRQNG